MMRPCGTCSRVCYQCQNEYDRLKAAMQRQDERCVKLEIAYAEADDSCRDEIAQQLQDATEAWLDMGMELIDMEERGR